MVREDAFVVPRGRAGRLGGWIMSRRNDAAQRETLELVPLRHGQRILEVGHGPGVLLRLLAERPEPVVIAAIDPSPVMGNMARRRNWEAIRTGHVRLRAGTADAIPFSAATFDHVIAVNCVALWPCLDAALTEIARVAVPGGTLTVTWHSAQSRLWLQRRLALTDPALHRLAGSLGRHFLGVTRHDRDHLVAFTAVRPRRR